MFSIIEVLISPFLLLIVDSGVHEDNTERPYEISGGKHGYK
jgi:hypothetical protein